MACTVTPTMCTGTFSWRLFLDAFIGQVKRSPGGFLLSLGDPRKRSRNRMSHPKSRFWTGLQAHGGDRELRATMD